MCKEFVTCEECYEHRHEIDIRNNKQDIILTKLETEVGMVKKIMYSILGVLISGFVGTIFAVLSLG